MTNLAHLLLPASLSKMPHILLLLLLLLLLLPPLYDSAGA
jgi:hypothetical protein